MTGKSNALYPVTGEISDPLFGSSLALLGVTWDIFLAVMCRYPSLLCVSVSVSSIIVLKIKEGWFLFKFRGLFFPSLRPLMTVFTI